MAPDYEVQDFEVDERKIHAQRNNRPGYGRRHTLIKARSKNIIFAKTTACILGSL